MILIVRIFIRNRWGYLEIKTNPAFPDTVQAYAAGLAEGILTTDMIYKAYRWKGSWINMLGIYN